MTHWLIHLPPHATESLHNIQFISFSKELISICIISIYWCGFFNKYFTYKVAKLFPCFRPYLSHCMKLLSPHTTESPPNGELVCVHKQLTAINECTTNIQLVLLHKQLISCIVIVTFQDLF